LVLTTFAGACTGADDDAADPGADDGHADGSLEKNVYSIDLRPAEERRSWTVGCDERDPCDLRLISVDWGLYKGGERLALEGETYVATATITRKSDGASAIFAWYDGEYYGTWKPDSATHPDIRATTDATGDSLLLASSADKNERFEITVSRLAWSDVDEVRLAVRSAWE
jgi:hypothetical protein